MNNNFLETKSNDEIRLFLNKLNIEQLEELMIKQAKTNLELKEQLKSEDGE